MKPNQSKRDMCRVERLDELAGRPTLCAVSGVWRTRGRTHSRVRMKVRPVLLGTGNDGSTSPCILLTCETSGAKLLINCTECLQRLSCEHSLKLHRNLDGILLSSLEPAAIAGLPGLLLLMGDAGIGRVHVFGPVGTADFVRSLTRFVQPRTLVMASELTGNEAICWRGHTDVFVLPIAGTSADGVRSRSEVWLARCGYRLPRRVGGTEAAPPKKRARTDESSGSESESEDSSEDSKSESSDGSESSEISDTNGVVDVADLHAPNTAAPASEEALFEEMVTCTSLSSILIRRARADAALRARLIEQWQSRKAASSTGAPPAQAVPHISSSGPSGGGGTATAATAANNPMTAPTSRIVAASTLSFLQAIELLRLP